MKEKEQLIKIVSNQSLAELKDFIANNKEFKLNFTTEKGENLLHFCAGKITENTLSVIQILLEKDIDPLSINENFVSAMDIARKNNNIPAITLMTHYVNKAIKEEKIYY